MKPHDKGHLDTTFHNSRAESPDYHSSVFTPPAVRVPPIGGRAGCGWELVWQRGVKCGFDQSAFVGEEVAADIWQPGVADSSRGAGAGAVPVRQLWFRLRRARLLY
ncbi:MAG: hypothetical protein GX456_12175 [Verrucomicrobia bacterium]|nr:hypothetical protein [Verrucomicrobiota bacterium]